MFGSQKQQQFSRVQGHSQNNFMRQYNASANSSAFIVGGSDTRINFASFDQSVGGDAGFNRVAVNLNDRSEKDCDDFMQN